MANSKTALGFLTVLDHPQHGLFGGYLVLNTTGRPLEFHCTAPVKPNRAQEILYGPTLEPFLFGEQIGLTLVTKAKTTPLVVYTDRAAVLALREHVPMPVALVLAGPEVSSQTAHAGNPALIPFQLGRNHLAVAETAQQDRRILADQMADVAESLDLLEPFGRIREAIEEAQGARKAA